MEKSAKRELTFKALYSGQINKEMNDEELKIFLEANNLKEYYASEGKSRNKNMGILWITLSIVGVVIILFAIKKRD